MLQGKRGWPLQECRDGGELRQDRHRDPQGYCRERQAGVVIL